MFSTTLTVRVERRRAIAVSKKNRVYVYGNFGGLGPCVLSLETAERLAAQSDVIAQSHGGSFTEFLDRCRSHPEAFDAEWVEDLVENFDDAQVSLELPFSIDEVPGFGGGWFTTDARTAMTDDMPEEVIESGIGVIVDEMGGMPRYELVNDDISGIRAILEELGHTVREDQSIFDRMAF